MKSSSSFFVALSALVVFGMPSAANAALYYSAGTPVMVKGKTVDSNTYGKTNGRYIPPGYYSDAGGTLYPVGYDPKTRSFSATAKAQQALNAARADLVQNKVPTQYTIVNGLRIRLSK